MPYDRFSQTNPYLKLKMDLVSGKPRTIYSMPWMTSSAPKKDGMGIDSGDEDKVKINMQYAKVGSQYHRK